MRIYAADECARWCEGRVELDPNAKPAHDIAQPHRLRCRFPSRFTQLPWFSRCIESALTPRESCLVWVTDWGIFPSNENLHLFYRLRQTYGDVRLLEEAPGHLCLDYERAEVVTLIHLAALFGWDVHVIPSGGYARAFVSHDEWVELGFDDEAQFEETKKELLDSGLTAFVPE